MTVEENVLAGGFGSAVLEHLSDSGTLAGGPAVIRFGIPDRYVTHGKPELLHEEVGLTAERSPSGCSARSSAPRPCTERSGIPVSKRSCRSPGGAAGVPRIKLGKDAGSPHSSAMGATEDTAQRHPRPPAGSPGFRYGRIKREAPRFHEAPYGEERFPMWLCVAEAWCYARRVV